MLNLQKIEGYEFAGHMSSEESENVCRFIDSLLHLIKRRLLVDSQFRKEVQSQAGDCENLLLADVIEQIIRMERALMPNTHQERSGKEINLDALKKDNRQIKKGRQEREVCPSRRILVQRSKSYRCIKRNNTYLPRIISIVSKLNLDVLCKCF